MFTLCAPPAEGGQAYNLQHLQLSPAGKGLEVDRIRILQGSVLIVSLQCLAARISASEALTATVVHLQLVSNKQLR